MALSDLAEGTVYADIVKLRSVESGARLARWSGVAASAGRYRVFAKWPVNGNLASGATNVLSGGSGAATPVVVDQGNGSGQWHYLGSRDLAANDTWEVPLSDQAAGAVAADAVALALAPAPETPLDTFIWSPCLPVVGIFRAQGTTEVAT